MPTFFLFVLALLSLLFGALIEPPAAKAAARQKPSIPAASAPADEKMAYNVVSEDISAEASRRYAAVTLARRLGESDLVRIADEVRAKEKAPYEKTIVNFYLPGMKIGQGAWAIATYNPALKLNIVGLRRDEAEAAAAEAAADTRNVIGAWLTTPPAAPGMVTLYRDGAKVFAERRLRGGAKSVSAVVEARDQKGRRYSPADGGTDFLVVTWSGELALHDGPTVIAVAERISVAADKSAVKAAASPSPVSGRKRASSREKPVAVARIQVDRADRN